MTVLQSTAIIFDNKIRNVIQSQVSAWFMPVLSLDLLGGFCQINVIQHITQTCPNVNYLDFPLSPHTLL